MRDEEVCAGEPARQVAFEPRVLSVCPFGPNLQFDLLSDRFDGLIDLGNSEIVLHEWMLLEISEQVGTFTKLMLDEIQVCT